MSIKETIQNALENAKELLKAGELCEAAGIEKSEVDKAIKVLKLD